MALHERSRGGAKGAHSLAKTPLVAAKAPLPRAQVIHWGNRRGCRVTSGSEAVADAMFISKGRGVKGLAVRRDEARECSSRGPG